jgi:tRNA pseudouridine32 synthase/23S rRNA pseudouridine746 synthase
MLSINLTIASLLLLLLKLQSINSLHIPIIYESKDFLAINKPSGIPHHSTTDELGIVALIRLQYNQEHPTTRLYSVHRLDRVTSGILLLAKTPEAVRELTRLFREKKIVKYYTALSYHKATQKKQGWIQGGMERGRRKSWMLVRENTTNFAQTRFFSAGLGQLSASDGLAPLSLSNSKETAPLAPRTLLLLRPYTGKTHQLRVAAKSVGLPLAGDPVYKDRYDSSATLDRTYLHATALEIPASKDDTSICFPESISLWCPPPFAHFWQNQEEFKEVLQRLVDKHCESAELRALCRGPYHKGISP